MTNEHADLSRNIWTKLHSTFYDPKTGLFNARKLYKKLKKKGVKVTLKQVEQFIKHQTLGQLYAHRTQIDYYPITAPPYSYQADLVFFPKSKKINNGYNVCLTVIEITSRMGYAIPMKGKKMVEVLHAFKVFLDQAKEHQPTNLTTDSGSEFVSKSFKQLMQKHNVNHVTADEGDHNKMGMIERFNRTIKALISKYLTAYSTKKYIDALPDLLHNYNHTVHSSIGHAPAEVTAVERAIIRTLAQYKTQQLDQKKNLNIGDKVRILQRRALFGKEGPRWSEEIYTIRQDNVKSFKVEGKSRLFKHYELMKVHVPPEDNTLPRKMTSFDVETHLKKARQNRTQSEASQTATEPRARSKRNKPKRLDPMYHFF